ncbi:hypothetical protein FZEAL_1195 [Fusarium zealandicum]|uniref:Uncharacterized protein n=1 Tax=Fusarium zealandicum TaxID=1053134 RepID=A0A8H4XP24_9HYPO|nr:hypothetical protein FZEAL_1195 [Fusarium zealandicum]
MSNDEQNNQSPDYVEGGKRPYVSPYDENTSFIIGDQVYLLRYDGSREGPYLIATAPTGGTCKLWDEQAGAPVQQNADVSVDELEAV